jgi:large conductance mechanosensitive channel
VITYGLFIQAVVDFLLIAAALFVVIKAINTMNRKEAEKPAEPAAPSTQEKLLMEIRDLLKKQ